MNDDERRNAEMQMRVLEAASGAVREGESKIGRFMNDERQAATRVSRELRECGYPHLANLATERAADRALVAELRRLRHNGVLMIPKPSTLLRRVLAR